MQKALVGERGFEPLLASNQVAYLPIRCKIIRTCCNTIQTLLQVNSNNPITVMYLFILQSRPFATFRDEWWYLVGFLATKVAQNWTCSCGIDLQYLAIGRP